MNNQATPGLALLLAINSTVALAAHDELPEITIVGQQTGFNSFVINPDLVNAPATDSAQLLKKIPGANVNSNGTQTGIAQYRGMYGDRVNMQIDGMKISSGGPNSMDTPLSYIPRAQLDSLEVFRGIAPVSHGNETIGGSIQANSNHSSFTEGDQAEFHGNIAIGGHSADSGYDVSTLLTVANQNHRAHVTATRQEGDDYEFDEGDVTPTEYDHNNYKLGYGYQRKGHEASIEYMHNDTNESGTPSLPMDIIFADGDSAQAKYSVKLNQVDINTKIYWSQIDHRMSNYEMRTPATMMGMPMQRFALTDSESFGYKLDANFKFAGGILKLGTDGHLAGHNANIFNPMSAAFLIKNYNDIQRDVFGFFGEWNRNLSDKWDLEAGVRYTRVTMDAQDVSITGLPAMLLARATTLATSFNAADRSQNDDNVDAVVKLTHTIRNDTRVEIGLARKTRSPSYQERYLWLPLESTGGLADGNNYIGNIDLDSEVAYQFELGLDWRTASAWFAPRAFYHHVDDYIQGDATTNMTATMFNTMMTGMTGSSASLLQFTNVDARLYGIDADFGYRITPAWVIDGGISVVKGERRDNGDNLYRISPVNGRIALTHERNNWSATVETTAYLEKEDVSGITRELETAGYALLNLYGNYKVPNSGFTLVAGVDNVLDKEYAPHLGGINRVRNVDVAQGVRVPGPGINGYASLLFEW